MKSERTHGTLMALVLALLTARRYALEVGLALVVATATVASYQWLAVTPPAVGDGMWRFVASTLEP